MEKVNEGKDEEELGRWESVADGEGGKKKP